MNWNKKTRIKSNSCLLYFLIREAIALARVDFVDIFSNDKPK
jgi:hypothetical protein